MWKLPAVPGTVINLTLCDDHSHEYQKLPLISVEEFLVKHPEHKEADENALMVARIEDERREREALEQQRQELLKRKQKLIAENKKRREDLANLDNDLEKFIDVRPLPLRPISNILHRLNLSGVMLTIPSSRRRNRFKRCSRRTCEVRADAQSYIAYAANDALTSRASIRNDQCAFRPEPYHPALC